MRRILWVSFLLIGTEIALPKLGVQTNPETSSSEERQGVYAITRVNVIPMHDKHLLRDQTVVIENGKIVSLGTSERMHLPDAATVIDGSGKYLMPGLIDTHVHLNKDEHLILYLANGVTTVLNMKGGQYHLDLRKRIERGEILGPRVFSTGWYVNEPRLKTPEDAEKAVTEHKETGYDFIKIHGRLQAETYERLMTAAQEHNIPIIGHAPRNLSFETVLEKQGQALAHMEEIIYTHPAIAEKFRPYWGKKKQAQNGTDLSRELADVVQSLAPKVKESGIWITPTLISFNMIWRQRIDEVYEERLATAYMQYLSPTTRQSWKNSGYRSDPSPITTFWLKEAFELQQDMVRAFHEEGVPLMLGTDAPIPFVMPGYSAHEDLRLLVESGLTPYEALRAGTILPATFLRVADEVGTIEIGKRADLMLVNENPIENIQNTTNISGIFLNGRYLSRDTLDNKLADLAASYDPMEELLAELQKKLENHGAKAMLQAYKASGTHNEEVAGFVESAVNRRGYDLLGQNKIDEAIEVFTLNTQYFPDQSNPWDSLGEAYAKKGETEVAIQYYKKA
ncbi:amidohydrolase family protein, partial [candidate division KSB1 bacterium]|nr:amidohydrolase family protein [candidate division KSB1 bacterium]NIR70015.1 amidohydrolase family protein [candidate division KSB1 bacterium]NIS24414.1 amidohydrolase family protein [candidate division KSB1 bacterium]NIT71349.1 amidohydrolase family protein [candidate division KSB1 bacterium]NIU25029.1 amidohydrolase family protein [candidate division KSB1 bacterium]